MVKGWKEIALRDLGTVFTGGTPSTTTEDYWEGDINWFTPTEVSKGSKYLIESERKITELGLKKSSATLFPPNTLMVCTRATIGELSICKTDATTNQGFKSIFANEHNDIEYIYYQLLYKKIELIKRSSGSTFLELSTTDFRNFKIPVPPLPEQKKIAEILSKWDELIDAQTQLIKAKEKQKKGLMQKLLTGELRFPGFEGEWKIKELGQIGEVVNGLTYSPKDVREEGVLVLRSSNVQNRQLSFEDNVFVDPELSFNPVQEYDILICVRNGSRRLIGKNVIVPKNHEGLAFGAFMTVYRSKYNQFLNHLFDSDFFYKEVHRNLGATINSINNSDLKKFKFPIPGEKEMEQITAVLDSIDQEVNILNKQLINLQSQKKGLMQQLLTGKIRVQN